MVKKNTFLGFLLPALCGMSFFSCYYDSEEFIYGVQNCDTSDVTFSLSIVPILEANCYICHSNDNADIAADGNSLEGYDNVFARVIPGNASESLLYGDVAWLPGFSKMPQGQPQLSSCDIAKIEKWINDGALNN